MTHSRAQAYAMGFCVSEVVELRDQYEGCYAVSVLLHTQCSMSRQEALKNLQHTLPDFESLLVVRAMIEIEAYW